MAIAINIDVNTNKTIGAPSITIAELKDTIQAYVNSLYVNVTLAKSDTTKHTHSLSSLRGICKSDISDQQAIEEYLAEKY